MYLASPREEEIRVMGEPLRSVLKDRLFTMHILPHNGYWCFQIFYIYMKVISRQHSATWDFTQSFIRPR